jgi:hypothetical protein
MGDSMKIDEVVRGSPDAVRFTGLRGKLTSFTEAVLGTFSPGLSLLARYFQHHDKVFIHLFFL